MGIGTSIFLFAVGAILRFAVNVQTQGFNVHTIGVILMVVGIFGALVSLMFWSSWGGLNGVGPRRTYVDDGDVVVDDRRPVRRRRTTVEERETRL